MYCPRSSSLILKPNAVGLRWLCAADDVFHVLANAYAGVLV